MNTSPPKKADKARELITRVLTESLVHNRLDSPVRLALGEQLASGKIDELLRAGRKRNPQGRTGPARWTSIARRSRSSQTTRFRG